MSGIKGKTFLNKKVVPKTIDYLIIIIFAVILSMQSSSNFLCPPTEPNTDAGVWLYISSGIPLGKMPYLNSFDHKGPLLYILELVCISISKQYGIWIMDVIVLSISFILFYKILVLKNRRVTSVIITITAALSLAEFYGKGNIAELFAMPFIALSCYIYACYFYHKTATKISLLLFGISFAAVLLLRVNLVAPWCVFCLAILIESICNHSLSNISFYIRWFLLGTGLLLIPFFLWLLINHAFLQFVDQYIVFNINYSTHDSSQQLPRFIVFASFTKKSLVFVSLVLSLFPSFKKKDVFSISLSILIPFSTILCCALSGRLYAHYGIPLIPLCVLALSHSLSTFYQDSAFSKPWKELIISLSMLLVGGVFPLVGYIKEYYIPRTGFTPEFLQTISYIQEYSDENDTITVFGNRDSIYFYSNRQSASIYSYQYPIGNVDEQIIRLYFNDLELNKPKLIIVTQSTEWNGDYEELYGFISEHEYSRLLMPNDEIEVYLSS